MNHAIPTPPHSEAIRGGDYVPDDPLTGHNYDGIQEFDNPMPGWWKALFVASIGFSALYMAYYMTGVEGRDVTASYEAAVAENLRLQFSEIGQLQPDTPTLVHYMNDPQWVNFGQAVFKTHCASCHGSDGGGLVGPNLRDDHYKHVKELTDIADVIRDGAAAGAMPAWQNRLSTNEIALVSAYVAALRGEGGGKRGAEGLEIDPWPSAEAEIP